MDALWNLPWGTIGPWGIIGVICGFILRGDLVSRNTMKERMEDRDLLNQELKDRNQALASRFDLILEQNAVLLRGAESTRHVVEAIPQVIRDSRQEASGE